MLPVPEAARGSRLTQGPPSRGVLSSCTAGATHRIIPGRLAFAGERLGPYQIVSALGAGGMGEVYRAHDPPPGRQVAINRSCRGGGGDQVRLDRFTREARAIAALNLFQNRHHSLTEEADGGA